VIAGPRNQPTPKQFTAGAIRADRLALRALSTTLSLPYVAAGRIAAYVLFWTSDVHAGAGSLLVSEAGGTLPDIEGRPWTIRSDSVIVSSIPISTKSCSTLPAQPRLIRLAHD
jgi:myo-inositol-1(or 4)-monophosphatase